MKIEKHYFQNLWLSWYITLDLAFNDLLSPFIAWPNLRRCICMNNMQNFRGPIIEMLRKNRILFNEYQLKMHVSVRSEMSNFQAFSQAIPLQRRPIFAEQFQYWGLCARKSRKKICFEKSKFEPFSLRNGMCNDCCKWIGSLWNDLNLFRYLLTTDLTVRTFFLSKLPYILLKHKMQPTESKKKRKSKRSRAEGF